MCCKLQSYFLLLLFHCQCQRLCHPLASALHLLCSVGFTSVFVFSQVASLRQQLEQLQRAGGRGGGGVVGGCGPDAPCGRSLAAMERAHRHALEELQRQHDRQMKELEAEKARLLLEEAQDTARGTYLRRWSLFFINKGTVDQVELT